MIVKPQHKRRMGVLVMLIGLSSPATSADSAALERLKQYKEQEGAIYAHMKRYGINREDVEAMGRLNKTSPHPHVSVAAEKLLNSGEHYRIEMDEYVLTMKVPDGKDVAGQWIWPYTNTRTPDPAMARFLKQSNGSLKVADLGWHTCNSLFPPGLFGRCEVAGPSIRYQVLAPKEAENQSTPEKMIKILSQLQKSWIITQEEIKEDARQRLIDNRAGNRIVLAPESVVINGRVWVRDASVGQGGYALSYSYMTLLGPDRRLIVNFDLPNNFDYNAHPDPATWPAAIQRGVALMEEMAPSLRVSRINDDGAPDPFVIERVEPAPLPVREKRPVAD